MTVAVAAGNDCWRYYAGGVLTEADGCPTGIDHAVTLVGYTSTSDASEPVTNCTSSSEDFCRRASKSEKRANQCSSSSMYDEERNDSRGRFKYCCYTEVTETCETIDSGSPGTAQWKIQNSWGIYWGDAGFMHLEVSGGLGVSGINQVMEWVAVTA